MNETVVADLHQTRLTPLELVCLSGELKGKRYPLLPGRQNFGRGDRNQVQIEESTISQHHGVFEYAEEGRIVCYDVASRNGISRKGKKAPVIRLKAGEEIQIGALYFCLVKVEGERSSRFRLPSLNRLRVSRLVLLLLVLPMLVVGFVLFRSSRRSGATIAVQEVTPERPPSFVPAPRATAYPRETMVGLKTREMEEAAQQAWQTGQLADAFRVWQQILVQEPGNESAQGGIEQLERTAQKLCEEAMMMRDNSPSRAVEKIRLALAISTPSSDVHQQASRLLGEGT